MNLRDAIPADDLCFARLACDKLLKNLQGTASVGTSALMTGIPDPGPFFRESCRALTALATVLGTVAVSPSVPGAFVTLRAGSDRILLLTEQLCQQLTALATGPRSGPAVRAVAAKYEELCRAVEAFGVLVGEDSDRAQPVSELGRELFGRLEKGLNGHGNTAGAGTATFDSAIVAEKRLLIRHGLERRFGPLSRTVQQRLEEWPAERLRDLLLNVLDAPSLGALGLEE